MTCECAAWARTDGRLTDHHPGCPKFREERYVRVTMASGGSYTMREAALADVLADEISEADIGEKWTLELVRMTPEEYERLPEFEGH